MEDPMEQAPLFDRLGGREGVTAVVHKAMDNHYANPLIRSRFEHALQSREVLTEHAIEFFCTGLSGVPTYVGRALADAHAGMNVSEQEFLTTVDDILDAMIGVGIGQAERGEVLAVLYGMKAELIRL
jgi:hemoglobin